MAADLKKGDSVRFDPKVKLPTRQSGEIGIVFRAWKDPTGIDRVDIDFGGDRERGVALGLLQQVPVPTDFLGHYAVVHQGPMMGIDGKVSAVRDILMNDDGTFTATIDLDTNGGHKRDLPLSDLAFPMNTPDILATEGGDTLTTEDGQSLALEGPRPGDPVEILEGTHKGKTGQLLRYGTLPVGDTWPPRWAFIRLDETGEPVHVRRDDIRTRIQTAGAPIGGVVGGNVSDSVPPFRGVGTDGIDPALAARQRSAVARMSSGATGPPLPLQQSERSAPLQGAAASAVAGTVRVEVTNYTVPPGWESDRTRMLEILTGLQRTVYQIDGRLSELTQQSAHRRGHNSQASEEELDVLRNVLATTKANADSIEQDVRDGKPTSSAVKAGAMTLKLLVAGGMIGIGQSFGRGVADAAQEVFGADAVLLSLFEALAVHVGEVVTIVQSWFVATGAPIWPG